MTSETLTRPVLRREREIGELREALARQEVKRLDAGGLSGLRPAARWREERATDVFKTQSAWEWFKRNHLDELVASGQLIPSRGRRGDLVGPGIDDVVVGILRREAAPHGSKP